MKQCLAEVICKKQSPLPLDLALICMMLDFQTSFLDGLAETWVALETNSFINK